MEQQPFALPVPDRPSESDPLLKKLELARKQRDSAKKQRDDLLEKNRQLQASIAELRATSTGDERLKQLQGEKSAAVKELAKKEIELDLAQSENDLLLDQVHTAQEALERHFLEKKELLANRDDLGDRSGSKDCFGFAREWGIDSRIGASFIFRGLLLTLQSAKQLKEKARATFTPARARYSLPSQQLLVPFDHQKNRERWRDKSALSKDWDSRTISLAKMVPADSKVLECGAGRCILKQYLPAGCEYTPSDLYDRGHGTLILDCNDEHFAIPKGFDCCVLSGVIEYIIDVNRFAKEASRKVKHLVFSYAIQETNSRPHPEWANQYTLHELLQIFGKYGYQCKTMECWRHQLLLHLMLSPENNQT